MTELASTKAGSRWKRASKDKGKHKGKAHMMRRNVGAADCRVNNEQECAVEMKNNSALE